LPLTGILQDSYALLFAGNMPLHNFLKRTGTAEADIVIIQAAIFYTRRFYIVVGGIQLLVASLALSPSLASTKHSWCQQHSLLEHLWLSALEKQGVLPSSACLCLMSIVSIPNGVFSCNYNIL
jgi:hypothetical protein